MAAKKITRPDLPTTCPCCALAGSLACCEAFLSSQSVVLPLAAISGIITAVTPLANHLLAVYCGLGVAGAGFAAVLADSLGLAVAVGFIWRVNKSAPEGGLLLKPCLAGRVECSPIGPCQE